MGFIYALAVVSGIWLLSIFIGLSISKISKKHSKKVIYNYICDDCAKKQGVESTYIPSHYDEDNSSVTCDCCGKKFDASHGVIEVWV